MRVWLLILACYVIGTVVLWQTNGSRLGAVLALPLLAVVVALSGREAWIDMEDKT